ncbi:MAG TPA: ABC transporter permease [Lachnospiraceae bacterium]|jgi:putative aldouronate transport system permease protein|nr:ABC transporter permease [Lachnospiraceae bacterium]HCA70253.1 ABC transporter permease [Lachnospiraceae bacterium]HCM11585.1 ABC transporter permease [Lachnospiraceae bacterium]
MNSVKPGSKSMANRAADFFIRFLLFVIALTCILPFVHVLAKSLSNEAYVIAQEVYLWPKGLNIEAYKKVFTDQSIIRSFFVTIFVTVTFTLTGMILTVCAAYPLSRKHLKGRNFFTFLFMFTLYFAGGIIPDYLLMNRLHMLDTIWSIILPLAFSPYNLLIMKTSFQTSISDSLIESAVIDGASQFRILRSIVLPLSKPILATVTLFYAVGRWNAYQDALFYIKQNINIRPLQLKLYYLIATSTEAVNAAMEGTAQYTNPEVLKAACIIFTTVPIICVYPFIQKYFVKGTMVGAVKG